MNWLIASMGLSMAALVAMGVYLELRRRQGAKALPRWIKGGVLANLLFFAFGVAGVLFLGMQDVLARETAGTAKEISEALGLALIGIGLPTGLAAIGAGIALGPVGSAALAVIAEKPEMFGRTLIYLGLAEGIAIYGLVMSILLLGRI